MPSTATRRRKKIELVPFNNSPYMPIISLELNQYPFLGYFRGWHLKSVDDSSDLPTTVWVREGVDASMNYVACVLKEENGLGKIEFCGRNVGPGLLPRPIFLTRVRESDEVGLKAVQMIIAAVKKQDSYQPVTYKREDISFEAWKVNVPSPTWAELGCLPEDYQGEKGVEVLVELPRCSPGYFLEKFINFTGRAIHRRIEGRQERGRHALYDDIEKMAPPTGPPLHWFPQ